MAPEPSPHIPVLLSAVIHHAQVEKGEVWVDCTLGRGGHTEALLKNGARVIALDKDPQALLETRERLAQYGEQFTAVQSDFKSISSVLHTLGIDHVSGILADLGVSSPQLDEAARGFSFRKSGPVDMRMAPDVGESAEALIERVEFDELRALLRRFGEEPLASLYARVIKDWSLRGGGDTLSLAQVIEEATPQRVRRKLKRHPATKAFQALRIAVNDELGALEALLSDAPPLLSLGGRLLLISFHSLEDRMIKQKYTELSRPPISPRRGLPPPPDHPPPEFDMKPRKPLSATPLELEQNPRSRSAKLRCLIRTRRSQMRVKGA